MFAYIQDNEVIFTLRDKIQQLESKFNIVEYDESIFDPMYKYGKIISRSETVENAIKRVKENLVKKEDITNITDNDLEELYLSEQDFFEIKERRVFPEGIGEFLVNYVRLQSSGNFSGAQQYGSEVIEENDKVASMKNRIMNKQ